VPAGSSRHLNNDAAFDLIHDLEQEGVDCSAEDRETAARSVAVGIPRAAAARRARFHAAMLSGAGPRQHALGGEDDASSTTFSSSRTLAWPVVILNQFIAAGGKLPHGLGIFLQIALPGNGQRRGNIVPGVARGGISRVADVQAGIQSSRKRP